MELILYNIRSAHNVGSIFRTADGAGIKKIYLIGYTPAPLDQFDRPDKTIAKVALGAEKTITWQKVKSFKTLVTKLKKEGKEVVALEQDDKSIDYRKFKTKKSVVLVLGEETKGLPKEELRECDQIIEIPMKGQKESLNVSVAAGIAIFQLIQ
jgi:23S rRNA (guanosine2251-2'-O)-methyltransferase